MRRALLAISALVLLASCGESGSDISGPPPAPPPPPPPPPPAPVATVTLNLTAATLVPSETRQITATTRDAAGNTLSGRTISWTTSAANAATVNDGLVTGVAPGGATITATSEGQSATAAITVQDGGVAPTSGGTIVAANGKVSIVLPAGAVSAATPLRVAPLANPPSSSTVLTGTAYDFGPDGTQFAQAVTLRITYDATALPQGADASLLRLHRLENNTWTPIAGSTVDIASRTVSGATTHFSSYAVAAVAAPVASIEIAPVGPLDLTVGATRQLTATPKSASGQALDRPITWSTGNANIATVSTVGVVTAVASGSTTIVATSDGVSASVIITVTQPQPAQVFTSVSVGYHICGVTGVGDAWCWGRNDKGQVGDGSGAQRSRPVLVAGNKKWSQVTVGLYHTCGLTTAGIAWCWGNNDEAELGDGTTAARVQPVQVLDAPVLIQISAGSLHTCGITAGGGAWCWGDNRWGQLGDGTVQTRSRAVAVLDGLPFTSISAGQDRTCGVTQAHQAWCWGSNGGSINSVFPNDPTGILGIGMPNSPMTRPAQVVGNHQWEAVTSGYRYSCGRLAAGSVRCWGANVLQGSRGGMLGDGSLSARTSPALIATGAETFTYVGAGFYSACALATAGDAWCWGVNYAGEVGDGGSADLSTSTNHATPIKVTGGHKFTTLAIAKLNACGLTANGELWCWGSNIGGQLGDGTTTNSATPVRVVP